MIGFETIGNATVIAYDDEPVIATDAWVAGEAYFGSWGLTHEIPPAQRESIRKAKYQWFSHAHPDHLNIGSLPDLSHSTLLLSDHVGNRVRDDLTQMGHTVRVLPEREWVQLSPNIRVMSIADINQDSVLLLDVAGTLVLNLNDASDRGWGRFVRKVARAFHKDIYYLNLVTWGDADMINLFAEDGSRILPKGASKPLIAPRAQNLAIHFGANRVIPFSSFHRYQREDSVWANAFVPTLEDYYREADPRKPEILEPFLRVNCVSGEITPLRPDPIALTPRPAAEFDDHWNDCLEKDDEEQIRRYFQRKQALARHFGFVRFRVGGKEFTVDLNKNLLSTGLTFEVPRNSLRTAVQYEVFDDLLIGNFMKTTLHGGAQLYPHFTPVVAKYADNGRAQTLSELRAYKWQYYMRDPLGKLLMELEQNSAGLTRKILPEQSAAFAAAKNLYWNWKQR